MSMVVEALDVHTFRGIFKWFGTKVKFTLLIRHKASCCKKPASVKIERTVIWRFFISSCVDELVQWANTFKGGYTKCTSSKSYNAYLPVIAIQLL